MSEERKRLRVAAYRSAATRAELADQIATLKLALFAARDRGEDMETRASGDMLCPVCGDAFRNHPRTYCSTAVGICTGERFKL